MKYRQVANLIKDYLDNNPSTSESQISNLTWVTLASVLNIDLSTVENVNNITLVKIKQFAIDYLPDRNAKIFRDAVKSQIPAGWLNNNYPDFVFSWGKNRQGDIRLELYPNGITEGAE